MVKQSRPTLNEMRRHFIDPEADNSAVGITGLMAQAIMVMAAMYRSHGTDLELSPEAQKALADLDSADAEALAKVLKREMGTRFFDRKFAGQIHPQGNKIAMAAQFVGTYMNTNTVVREVSPVESEMEDEVIARVAGWFGYDAKESSGNLVTGGTSANLAALWVAREKAMRQSGDPRADYFVFYPEMRHYSVLKSCDILGKNIIGVPLPVKGFKTDIAAAETMIREYLNTHQGYPMALVGLAGETETAEVEDLAGLGRIARKFGIHFHVDAAYGGPYILSKEKKRFRGIDRADSITVDPHKMMYVPYAAALVLFRNHQDHALIASSMVEARYLLKGQEMEANLQQQKQHGLTRVEGSMGSGGVLATWATLQSLGEEGLAVVLDHTLDLTQYAYRQISKSKLFRPLNNPELNTLLVGLRADLPDEQYNEVILKAQRAADQRGVYVSVNEGIDGGRSALRFVAMHPHMTNKDVAYVWRVLAEEVERAMLKDK